MDVSVYNVLETRSSEQFSATHKTEANGVSERYAPIKCSAG